VTKSQISIFSLFWIFNYNFIVYAYFTYAVTASTITDDVTKSLILLLYTFNKKNVDYLTSFNKI